MKTIAIIAALDTKGLEAEFTAELIRKRGHRTLMIDIGVMGEPTTKADISAAQIAHEGGVDLNVLRSTGDKAQAMVVMTRGAAVAVARLYEARRFDGILGLGGSAGTTIASSSMHVLPIGVPKIIVSTVAAGDTRNYVGVKDITLMYSVVDIAGINGISARVLGNAVGAAVGMVESDPPARRESRLIAATMFGNTTMCVDRARSVAEANGFEVLVFHATGTGGMTMEGLIADGLIDGVLDLTTTEWADELCGGVFSAGPRRLEAAGRMGIPQVIAPGCLDMVNFGSYESVPERFKQRKLFRWNANVTLMRTDVEENRRLGRIIGERLNSSLGSTAVILPLRGLSQLGSEGAEFWSPEADQALFDSMREILRSDIPIIEMNVNINDPEFADRAAQELLRMMEKSSRPTKPQS